VEDGKQLSSCGKTMKRDRRHAQKEGVVCQPESRDKLAARLSDPEVVRWMRRFLRLVFRRWTRGEELDIGMPRAVMLIVPLGSPYALRDFGKTRSGSADSS